MLKVPCGFRKLTLVSLASLAFLLGGIEDRGLADSADQWIRRATGAATEWAKGNPLGALHQAIPPAKWQPSRYTNLQADPSGIGLQQRIQPLQSLSTKHLNVSGAYNTAGRFQQNGRPHLSQNVQVSSGNPFVRNTTTFLPPWQGRRKST